MNAIAFVFARIFPLVILSDTQACVLPCIIPLTIHDTLWRSISTIPLTGLEPTFHLAQRIRQGLTTSYPHMTPSPYHTTPTAQPPFPK